MTQADTVLSELVVSDIAIDGDIGGVMALVRDCGVFSDTEVAVAGDMVADGIAGDEDYGFVFYRTPDGQVAGYSCFGPVCLTKSAYDLYWIAVAPAYQRHKLAAKILALTLTRIREAGGSQVYAETSSLPGYAPARAFYARQGFAELVRMKDFYKPGDDKVVFRLDL